MTFEELSPEEISFIYLLTDDMLESFNEVLHKGGISYVMDSPLGKVEIFKEFTPDDLRAIKSSLKVELLTSISKKLSPIVELIGEENQDIIDKVRVALFPVVEDKEVDDDEE